MGVIPTIQRRQWFTVGQSDKVCKYWFWNRTSCDGGHTYETSGSPSEWLSSLQAATVTRLKASGKFVDHVHVSYVDKYFSFHHNDRRSVYVCWPMCVIYARTLQYQSTNMFARYRVQLCHTRSNSPKWERFAHLSL